MENSERIKDWLSTVEPKTRELYHPCWKVFSDFAQRRGKDPLGIVEEFRAAKYQGEREKDRFLDEWNDVIRAFNTWLKSKYSAPFTRKNFLVVVKSYLKYWKIPLDVELPKHPYVLYHNRDLFREQIRLILSRASPRDRAIYLLMAESGLRAETAITLKYWQIQDDFEKDTVPMRILTPSETLKDHVGDRWSFIGEDGVRELREYLKPRMPLNAQDYVFASERPGKVKGEQFSVASLSVKFHRIVRKLNLEKGAQIGKPGHYRMHGLRKYFRNNMKADPAYREFWMGHSIGVDAHYISRDPEIHRKEYRKNYESLRIQEPATPAQLTEIADKLKQKDLEIQELKTQNQQLFSKINKLDETMRALIELGDKEFDMTETQEKTKLGLIVEFLRLEIAKELKTELQKMKEKENE
jgi:hypothetical protein